MSLRFAMIVFTALTIWMGLSAKRVEKERRITELRSKLGDFSARDENKFEVRRSYSSLWDVYLPYSGAFDLCLATQGAAKPGTPPAEKRVRISSGYVQINALVGGLLNDNGSPEFVLKVSVNGVEQITLGLGNGSQITNARLPNRPTNSITQSTDQPLELIRMLPIVGTGVSPGQTGNSNLGQSTPVNELVLWIEKR